MMAEYDNTNTGAIFRNKRKDTDKHPDGTGTANIEGVEYWVSSWNKTSKSGEQFRSLSFKRKDGSESKQAKAAAGIPDSGDPYGDCPF